MKDHRLVASLLVAGGLALGGCAMGQLVGGMAQNYEYAKLIEVHPKYNGLENRTIAVLVELDMMTKYEHPNVEMTIATNLASRIQRYVPGARVVAPNRVAQWRFRTPQWSSMPYSEMAERLGVDRLVHVDVYEYRLNPPGNRYLWEGVCSAYVSVAEVDGLDPDSFADSFTIESLYPAMSGVTWESADAVRIQAGLLKIFVDRTSWLFYAHLEPKWPDKYEGPDPEQVWREEQAKRARKG